MGELVGAFPELPYVDRLATLKKRGIALWDVCGAAERHGCLDTNIIVDSVELNDFGSFFAMHRQICLICFNGRRSEKLFRRYVSQIPFKIDRAVLESTSPANTHLTKQEKLPCWRRCLNEYIT
jgi:TDG/mug DNA glycosylase family protein